MDQSKGKWVLSIPPKLSGTGRRKREYFARKNDAEKRAQEIRSQDEHGARLLRRAGPDMIRLER